MYNRVYSQLKQGLKSTSSTVRSTIANNRGRSAVLAAGVALTPYAGDSPASTPPPAIGGNVQGNRLFSQPFAPRQTRDGAAVQVSEEILGDVPLVKVEKVLVVGSGGLSIGQAGEFDYSGL